MPYIIQQVHGLAPLRVGERRWGDAGEIDFGAMTSCIALVEQDPDRAGSVRAIHLSILSDDGTPVYYPDSNVRGQVSAIMQAFGNLRACLGRIDVWQNSESPQVQDFFASLMQGLDMLTWVQLPDGHLRARMHNGAIQYDQGGGWVDVPAV